MPGLFKFTGTLTFFLFSAETFIIPPNAKSFNLTLIAFVSNRFSDIPIRYFAIFIHHP